MSATNAEYFFQTTASIEDNERRKRKAANTSGSPLKFPTKLLGLQINQILNREGDVVVVAEAGGAISALKISTGEVSRVATGIGSPVTSLAYTKRKADVGSPFDHLDIFAGCWDKRIIRYSFAVVPRATDLTAATAQIAFQAHSDFVKCLCVAPTADGQQVLISGGADGELNFWTLHNSPDTPIRLATLRPNCRAIECIVLDPLSSPDQPSIFFSTSQREIFQVILPTLADFSTANLQVSNPIVAHETSVYSLTFDDDGDLWTASADKTAKQLSRDSNWAPITTLPHPDFVRDIAIHEVTKVVATACRDEEIRLWNSATSELLHIFSGHFEEVTGLAISGNTLVSISIDATVRRWSLAPEDIRAEIAKAKNPDLLQENPEPQVEGIIAEGMLTEEEEAELRALMEEEDEEELGRMAVD